MVSRKQLPLKVGEWKVKTTTRKSMFLMYNYKIEYSSYNGANCYLRDLCNPAGYKRKLAFLNG